MVCDLYLNSKRTYEHLHAKMFENVNEKNTGKTHLASGQIKHLNSLMFAKEIEFTIKAFSEHTQILQA